MNLPKVHYYNMQYCYIFILFILYMQVEEEQENLRKRQEVCIHTGIMTNIEQEKDFVQIRVMVIDSL